MKKNKRLIAICAAVAALMICPSSVTAADKSSVNVTINVSKDRKAISPYIYGVNSELMEKNVSCTAIRAGGNRFSAYNWETNASNAGSDWKHSSDNYFQQSLPEELDNAYGGVAINLSRKCAEKNNAYSFMTLQMAGYVAADMTGTVEETEVAPSSRWNRVEFAKNSEFSLEPDPNDGVVYMDEFVNYLVNTLGNSQTPNGIKGYSLDNEPALWRWTHQRMHPDQPECAEIIERSKALASAVKNIDPSAEIFGPALFGYSAFVDFGGAPDWREVNRNGDYRWFIDYYLDEMKKAEVDTGARLLDVLDIHFYTEAKGECGERSCDHYDREGCVKARLNSTRSLWEEGYKENSWIVDTGAEFFPILPNLQKSIDKYYPGTKLAITEYDFGASRDITGAIAEADALGIFAKNGVYLATLFAGEAYYQCAAINLYTNYDRRGSGFGDTLVYCETDNIERSTAYAAVDEGSDDVITLVITNKAFKDSTTANIKIKGAEDYGYVRLYGLESFTPEIIDYGDEDSAVTVSGDMISYEMRPRSVALLVIAKDREAVNARLEGKNPSDTVVSEPFSETETVEDSKSDSNIGWIVGSATAALAAVGATVFGVTKKRKAK